MEIIHQNTPDDFTFLLNTAIPHGMLIMTEEGVIHQVNMGIQKQSGYTDKELIGQPATLLLPQEDNTQGKVQQEIQVAIDQGYAEETGWVRKKDGTSFWARTETTALKDDQGSIRSFLQIIRNYSEHKHLEDEFIDAREMTESIIETIRESLLVLDGRMRVMMANHFFYETFQVSHRETIGKSLYMLGNGQWNIGRLRELLEQVLPEKNPFQDFEVVHDFPHIGKRIMLLNARQILLRGEPRERILLAIEDITERKELQQRKDDFISMAAHELKTPLTSIKAYAQITEKAFQEERYRDVVTYISRMEAQIERLNMLILDLLDVSRIESGKLAFTLTSFDFDMFVRETIADLEPSFSSHKLQIKGQTHAIIHADRERTAQAITNLITNAVKYSPKAELTLMQLERANQEVRLHVTDYGVGIEEQHREKIFERFYRVNDTTDKTYPGLGIGLYIAAQIIEREGGRIWLTSTPGKGSTFSFSLPLVSEEGER